jgi:hypothetical protein
MRRERPISGATRTRNGGANARGSETDLSRPSAGRGRPTKTAGQGEHIAAGTAKPAPRPSLAAKLRQEFRGLGKLLANKAPSPAHRRRKDGTRGGFRRFARKLLRNPVALMTGRWVDTSNPFDDPFNTWNTWTPIGPEADMDAAADQAAAPPDSGFSPQP